MDIHGDKIMQVKQTTIALLICSLFASGAVLANSGGHRGGGGLDVDVDDSFQHNDKNSHNFDLDVDIDKSVDLDVDKSDNDSYNDTNSHNKTFKYTDNSKDLDFDWSNEQKWITTKILTDKMIAKSSVKGKLSDVSVSYSSGGSSKGMSYQPRGRKGGDRGGDDCCSGVTVTNTNTLTGANGAAGITSIAQNVGGNALAQQSVSINTK
ncbi:hypothetical protein [Vibrio japonicus]|uniref:Heme utilization protein n=1 Tax=Vibrio japonicus TaxID=1824638 RepID=A0ABY5LG17_9VIBR|nr:hypothetical protein [Vibrio japonicus]UUM30974.1 hypothetical protein NP165_02125 [Vibrio japonicus]